MALNTLGRIVIGTTLAGGIVVSGITWNGSDGLESIRNTAESFKNKIVNLDTSLTNWKTAFNNLKTDAETKLSEAQTKLNEKLALISSLQSQIAELNGQVASGNTSMEEASAEIEALQKELEKANQEVATLKAEIEAMASEVGTKGETVESAPVVELQGVTEGGTVSAPTTPEVSEPVAEAPAPVQTFNINNYLSTSAQNTLTASGLTGVTNIYKAPLGQASTEEIVIVTSNSAWRYDNYYLQQSNFANIVRPELYTKFNTASATIVFIDVNGNVLGGMDKQGSVFSGKTNFSY
jgi:uncharacterized phage infection (PIP) family protein YhgE